MENGLPIIRRDISHETALTPSISSLMLVLLVLVVSTLSLLAVLYFFRRRQAAMRQSQLLPSHHNPNSHHHRVTITGAPWSGKIESSHVHDEKRNLIENSSGPPDSPIPEIRITFPDEEEPSGKKNNGRVVVVRIGDCGSVGMEPLPQEDLPPYQSTSSDKFHSLDLERIGGLREKAEPQRWS